MAELAGRLLADAKFFIDSYPMQASEKLIEKTIFKEYNISLKTACNYLVLVADLYKNNEGNLVVVFKNPYWDRLARLITYGNGKIPGSKILQIAFNALT